jgi:hypothetical protein
MTATVSEQALKVTFVPFTSLNPAITNKKARKESYSSFTNLNLNRNNVNKILNHLHFRRVQDNVSKHGRHLLLVTQVWRTIVYSPPFPRRLPLLRLVRFGYRPKIMAMNFFGGDTSHMLLHCGSNLENTVVVSK